MYIMGVQRAFCKGQTLPNYGRDMENLLHTSTEGRNAFQSLEGKVYENHQGKMNIGGSSIILRSLLVI